MFNLINKIQLFSQIDARVYDLEKQIELYRVVLMAMILAVIILIIICLLQRLYYTRMRLPGTAAVRIRPGRKKTRRSPAGVDPSGLPDPGLIFRFALPDDGGDKLITIGRTEGSIKTWSTEIINDHLELHVIYYVNMKEKKLYELPDPLYTDYALELKCRGNVLIHYPGLDGYRRMNPSEKIYITAEPDLDGRISFSTISAARPVRFRLGSELGEWDRFISGYFEFHLYLQDHEVERENGMPAVEKYFMLRLYRIYPGYDVSSPDAGGLYPMIDPFSGEIQYEQ
ncbi:MAG TPA: hypothetical protein PK514_07315 [Spirochaetota bacterium]|nr:hypothetical protein [Spirochaetota bacterium]